MSKRLLSLLVAFADKPDMTVSELSERMGIPASTVYRLLRPLRDAGLLMLANGSYRIGPKVLQLAEAAKSTFDVAKIANPVMERLAHTCGETVLLTAVTRDQAIAVHVVPGSEPVRFTFNVGQTRPLHAGASSKVLFSHLSESQRDRVLRESNFERKTKKTVVSVEELRKQLAAIRRQGYAISADEWEEGVLSIAAPIISTAGLWGLSVVGLSFRFDRPKIKTLTARIVESAREVERLIADATEPVQREAAQ